MDADGTIESSIDFFPINLQTSNATTKLTRITNDAINGKCETIKTSYGLKLRKSLSINTKTTTNHINKQKRHHNKTLNRIFVHQHNAGQQIGKNQRLGFVTFKE